MKHQSRRHLAMLLVCAAVLLSISATYAQEHFTVTGDNGVQFTINLVQFNDTAGKQSPKNKTFVLMLGELTNTTSSRQCVYAGQIELKIGSHTYQPDGAAMQSFQSTLATKIDYIGVLFGQCLKARETVSTFVIFDAEPFDSFELTFLARKIGGSLSHPATIDSVQPSATITDTPISFTATPVPIIYRIKGSTRVNIRSCASTGCSIVTTLAPGTQLNVTGENNGWYNLVLDDGTTGFISASLVSSSVPQNNPTATRLVSTRIPRSTPFPTSVPVIASPVVQPPPANNGGVSCGGATTCTQMTSCAQAYACLAAGRSSLDRDKDGVPCESICPGG